MTGTKQSAEQLFRPNQRGPRSTLVDATNPWIGQTSVLSGTATATVSTTQVQSNSIILMSTNPASIGIDIGSGQPGIVVQSIVDGVSFALSRSDGSISKFANTVSWEIIRR